MKSCPSQSSCCQVKAPLNIFVQTEGNMDAIAGYLTGVAAVTAFMIVTRFCLVPGVVCISETPLDYSFLGTSRGRFVAVAQGPTFRRVHAWFNALLLLC